jgi:YD repeat-containing protein
LNSDGNLDHKLTFKYDDKGNKTEETRFDSDGKIDYTWTFKYEFDENNNWIKRVDYNGESPEYIIERMIEYYK